VTSVSDKQYTSSVGYCGSTSSSNEVIPTEVVVQVLLAVMTVVVMVVVIPVVDIAE
jgi:hypothetical protein